MSTLSQLLRTTEQRLARAGISDARLEAELLWMTSLDIDRALLYTQLNDEPDPARGENAEALIMRRLRREPVAYLMGYREFYGLAFSVAPGVLIPRPDTETLVAEALRLLKERGEAPLQVADVGAGSGIIGISLAVALPNAQIYAIDIAERARHLTAHNAQRLGVNARVDILEGDLLTPLTVPVDLIAANLPYVASAEIPRLEPEISLYEPREALDGGDDGLDLIRRLLADAPAHLKEQGCVLLELDPRQMRLARPAARRAFPTSRIRALRDLAGHDRVLAIETGDASPASAPDEEQQADDEQNTLNESHEDLIRDARDDPAPSEASNEHDGADGQTDEEEPHGEQVEAELGSEPGARHDDVASADGADEGAASEPVGQEEGDAEGPSSPEETSDPGLNGADDDEPT